MIDFVAIAAHYAASCASVFLALALAYIVPLSAAFDASEEVNLQTDVVWVIASIVGLAIVVYSIYLLPIGLLEGLVFSIWMFSAGYVTPRYLVLIVALLLPDFRFVDSPNPLIDLDKLPTELSQPITEELDAFKKAPLFEHRFHFSWMDFTLRVPRLRRISQNELQAMYARATERAKASEQALHQQAVDLEAQQVRDLARARFDFLAAMGPRERGLLAAQLDARAEADARVARQYDRLLADKETFEKQVVAVIAERNALKAELSRLRAQQSQNSDESVKLAVLRVEHAVALGRIHEIAHERDVLAGQMQRLMAEGVANAKEAVKRNGPDAKRAELDTKIIARTEKVLVDSDALENEVARLTNRNNLLRREVNHWKAQAKKTPVHGK